MRGILQHGEPQPQCQRAVLSFLRQQDEPQVVVHAAHAIAPHGHQTVLHRADGQRTELLVPFQGRQGDAGKRVILVIHQAELVAISVLQRAGQQRIPQLHQGCSHAFLRHAHRMGKGFASLQGGQEAFRQQVDRPVIQAAGDPPHAALIGVAQETARLLRLFQRCSQGFQLLCQERGFLRPVHLHQRIPVHLRLCQGLQGIAGRQAGHEGCLLSGVGHGGFQQRLAL